MFYCDIEGEGSFFAIDSPDRKRYPKERKDYREALNSMVLKKAMHMNNGQKLPCESFGILAAIQVTMWYKLYLRYKSLYAVPILPIQVRLLLLKTAKQASTKLDCMTNYIKNNYTEGSQVSPTISLAWVGPGASRPLATLTYLKIHCEHTYMGIMISKDPIVVTGCNSSRFIFSVYVQSS